MAIKRLYDTLVGATVNVNQLVDADTSSVTIQSGHKYYAVIGGTRTIANSTGTAISVTGGTDMVTDLTDYFGSTIADYIYSLETATAGAGVAKLREWGFLTGEYIPYNAGTLKSVEARSHVMRGFNQWDEETIISNSRLRSKSYIPVFPNTTYYFQCPSGTYADIGEYSRQDVSSLVRYQYKGGSSNPESNKFTTDANTHYILFTMNSAYGTTYNHDICINLSSDRNGEYEPYHEYSYDLGTDTLRGLFKLDGNNQLYADGDRKASDGTVTRKYGVVDLGTLNWIYYDIGRYFYSLSLYTDDASKAKYQGQTVSGLYKTRSFSDNPPEDMLVCVANSVNVPILRIANFSYTDAATFKTAMSGVMLVYELATPTTEQSTPFTNPQICDPDGTEEYVTSNGVPVGHETRYQL